MVSKSERFELRLDEVLMNRLDKWRIEQGESCSRAEAVRELVLIGLDRSSRHAVHLTDGDRLIIAMLADLSRGKDQPEIDPVRVMKSIYGGHLWALKWEYVGLFHDHTDSPGAVSLVVDVLDMWNFIEEAAEKFSTQERARIVKEVGPVGEHIRFVGFDGNNEAEYLSIARHLIADMGRFARFNDHSLNSHHPSVSKYCRMLKLFEPIRAKLIGRKLSVDEVILLLKADQA